jgi:hypothetical protein
VSRLRTLWNSPARALAFAAAGALAGYAYWATIGCKTGST